MKSFLTSSLILTIFTFMNFPQILRASDPLQVGAEAPSPAAVDQDGNPFSLSSAYESGTVLVYFYPKADTGGCTKQACSLRDAIEDLKGLGVTVVGVSKDSPESQKKFQEKYDLPFTLIADDDRKVAEAFGVGGVLGFSNRSSFLVKGGKIVWLSPKAKTEGHADEVKEALKSLEG